MPSQPTAACTARTARTVRAALSARAPIALAVLCALPPAAVAQPPVEVIYSTIPGHSTAEAPGTGLDFTSLLDLHGSPNGRHWIFKGFVDDPENDVIVVGSGSTGSVVAREAGPSPVAGRNYEFMDSAAGINDAGQWAFGARLDAPTTDDEVLIAFDGVSQSAPVREGDMAPGLTDPGGAGNELFGNSLNSVHVLSDGTLAFRADLIQNIDTAFESALYQGASVVAQEGTQLSPGVIYDSFIALGGNTFSSSADGSAWIVEADIDGNPVNTLEAVVVSGAVEVRDGDMLPGAALPVDAIFGVEMSGSGDWMARGDLTDDTDWAVRNGVVVALTGDPIVPGAGESWGDSILALEAGPGGRWALAGSTDNPNPDLAQVAVVDGDLVALRAGDPVDLDGDGLPNDDVEIDTVSPNDLLLADDGSLYAFVDLRDSNTGAGLGDAFVRVVPVLFADGFESGDLTAWSASVGG